MRGAQIIHARSRRNCIVVLSPGLPWPRGGDEHGTVQVQHMYGIVQSWLARALPANFSDGFIMILWQLDDTQASARSWMRLDLGSRCQGLDFRSRRRLM